MKRRQSTRNPDRLFGNPAADLPCLNSPSCSKCLTKCFLNFVSDLAACWPLLNDFFAVVE